MKKPERAAQAPDAHADEAKGLPECRQTLNRFGMLNAFVDCSMAALTRAEALTWLVLYRDTSDGTARTNAADVARLLHAAGAASVKVVHLPGLADGEDIADWLPRQADKAAALAALQQFTDAVPAVEPGADSLKTNGAPTWNGQASHTATMPAARPTSTPCGTASSATSHVAACIRK